jgi:hypothetical protein
VLTLSSKKGIHQESPPKNGIKNKYIRKAIVTINAFINELILWDINIS